MTQLTQLMRDAAAVMRQRSLPKVENLLADPEAVRALRINKSGLSLLEDLRKHTARGLESQAAQIERDLRAQAEQNAKLGRFDPPSPALRALLEQRREARRKAS